MIGSLLRSIFIWVLVFSLNLSSISPAFAGGAQSIGYSLIDDRGEDKIGTTAASFPLEQLPEDIQKVVVGFLDVRDLINISQVSKKFHGIAKSFLWNQSSLTGEDFSSLKVPVPNPIIVHLSNVKIKSSEFRWLLGDSGFKAMWLDSVEFISSSKDEVLPFVHLSKELTHLKISNSQLDPVASELSGIIKNPVSVKLFDLQTSSMIAQNRKLLQEALLDVLEKEQKSVRPIKINLPINLNATDVDNDEIIRIGKIKDKTTSLFRSSRSVNIKALPSNLDLFRAQDRVDSPNGGWINACYNKSIAPYTQFVCGFDVYENPFKLIGVVFCTCWILGVAIIVPVQCATLGCG